MAEGEILLILGLTAGQFVLGLVMAIVPIALAYAFNYMVLGKLRHYLDRYLGDHSLSDGLMKLLGLSILVSAASIGFGQFARMIDLALVPGEMNYLSLIVLPIINTAAVALEFLRWGVWIGALLFIGFSVYHAATQNRARQKVVGQPVQARR